MYINYLCPPAFLYLCFALTQIIIDLFKNTYTTALIKFLIMIIYTIALNILCMNGYMYVSWLLVFIPFILMSILISLLLFVFGFSKKTGKIKDDLNYNKYIECTNANCELVNK